ncbi:MAG: serine/threonine protein kinase [Planctomycetes bacterium]|nr:serine/threonine protein kinase [Planctomycetota bacterium]
MDASTHQEIKRLYFAARAKRGPERERFLDEHCAGELRAEVEGLLRQTETLGGFLEQPATAGLTPETPAPLTHPERVGAYRILRPLGFGGMGVVYLAEQDSPKREVALKLLRFDSASPRQLERFAQEAELLGRLSHPGIARVYEAGWAETETGRRPFFALEFVAGLPLHEYVLEHDLGLAAKLALVSQVAEAAHYAHERGVVHRDLKPSNVLVDERGQPKVLDFGVARPLGMGSSGTQTGQLVGTLSYMSPEQAAGEGEISAQSDVYSLGVILYELLTGRLPLALDGVPLHEAVRRVREDDPIAAGSVKRELKGDLETILATALAKEPARRYATAAEFAEDLRLYLDHRPIRARKPTSLYVAWKLVRRHRLLAATALLLFLALSAAQYVSYVVVERGHELRARGIARDFYHELNERQRIREKIVGLKVEAERMTFDPRTATLHALEDWLSRAELQQSRLEEYRAFRDQGRLWIERADGAGAVESVDEKEYALFILDDTVETLESMKGPRGDIPKARVLLEQLRAAAREARR